jgi:hypothetical protein
VNLTYSQGERESHNAYRTFNGKPVRAWLDMDWIELAEAKV